MDAKKIREVIKQGESETIEFKKNFNRQTIEALVAFANTKGGKVLSARARLQRVRLIRSVRKKISSFVSIIKKET